LEGSGRDLIEILSQNLPGAPRKNMKNVRIACIPAEIRTMLLPNTSLERFIFR
jgi:hypothetical protein